MTGNSITSQFSNGRQITSLLKKDKQIYKLLIAVSVSQGEEGENKAYNVL